jgi:diketogulonate reductase-like aldo/keto reductase
MPVLGLGTWQLTDDTAGTIAKALELGYPMIDTSGDYGTQPGIGEGLKQSGAARDSFYLVTKVEETDDAYAAARKNLDELQLDFANLMLIHRPPDSGAGEELWQGLIRARDAGLTKDIGVSNYSIEQMQALAESSGEMPSVNQIEWSPFGHSEEILAYCQDNNIIIQAYSPLARSKRLDNDVLEDMASRYGKSTAQIIIRWNLQLGIIPIVKANREEHLKENIDVFDFVITDDDMATLNGLNEHYSALSSAPLYA